jgi:nuclear pore complex protein Nup214
MEPKEREVNDFCFRQLRKVRVGDAVVGGASQGRCSLICTSNRFGMTFFGCKSGVYAFKTSVLHTVDQDEDLGPQNVMADISCLRATHIPTPSPPLDVGLSCDELTLSVCLHDGKYLKCYFFDTRMLTKRGSPLGPFTSIALTTEPDVCLCALAWSPASPELLAVALSNQTLTLLEVKQDVSIMARKEVPVSTVCWSPKGKQLAVGLRDGTVVQLKPSSQGFEVKKSIPCPDVFNGEPQQVTDLYWLSTFQFAVVYTPQFPANSTPSFVFLSVPKSEAPLSLNFDDIFYGTGTKQSKFYFCFISKWNILLTSSANAIESVVFAQHQVDGGGAAMRPWEKWELEDTGRAEAPLDEANDETFPAGMALSYSSEEEIKIDEATTLPPCPLLLLYTDRGVLCPFSVINTGCSPNDIKALSSSPQPLPSDPAREPVFPKGEIWTTGAPLIPSSELQRSSLLQQPQQMQLAMETVSANPPGNPRTGIATGGGPFCTCRLRLASASSSVLAVSLDNSQPVKTGIPSAIPTAQMTHPLAISSSAPCRLGVQTVKTQSSLTSHA